MIIVRVHLRSVEKVVSNQRPQVDSTEAGIERTPYFGSISALDGRVKHIAVNISQCTHRETDGIELESLSHDSAPDIARDKLDNPGIFIADIIA